MYLPQFLDLRVGFSKYFTAVPATTEALRDECFRIRHEVYCKELQYEPLRPDGRETDAYDAHSVYCLLRANESGRFIGCIRLILPNPQDPATLFPFEKTCAATIERDLVDPLKMDRTKVAEVSRLAVVSAYRRRKSDQDTAGTISQEDFGSPERPRFPYVPVGLYLGMIAQAQRFGIDTLFVLTEPRLARHLSLLGVHIKRIGGPVEHRGRARAVDDVGAGDRRRVRAVRAAAVRADRWGSSCCLRWHKHCFGTRGRRGPGNSSRLRRSRSDLSPRGPPAFERL